MTTIQLTTPAIAARPLAAFVARAGVPAAVRLRAIPMPSAVSPIAASSSAVTSSATRLAVDVPAIDGNWSRDDFGMTIKAQAANAQAAKHGKAVAPPRGTTV